MAFNSAEGVARRSPPGVWRVDYLETGVQREPKRLPGAHRVRPYGTFRKIRDNKDLVRSWLIVGVFGTSGGVALVQIVWYFR